MKKAISILITITILLNIAVFGEKASSAVISDANNIDDKISSINYEQIFLQEDDEYLVFFYKNICPYCQKVKPYLESYANKHNYKGIYIVNMDNIENKQGWYDMKSHHERYDKEIGELDFEAKVVYYPGENAEKYTSGSLKTENGQVIDYRILIANKELYERYKKNANAKIQFNKVYATDFTKRINLEDEKEFRVCGVPTVIKVKNGKIFEYYYGAEDVKNFFNK